MSESDFPLLDGPCSYNSRLPNACKSGCEQPVRFLSWTFRSQSGVKLMKVSDPVLYSLKARRQPLTVNGKQQLWLALVTTLRQLIWNERNPAVCDLLSMRGFSKFRCVFIVIRRFCSILGWIEMSLLCNVTLPKLPLPRTWTKVKSEIPSRGRTCWISLLSFLSDSGLFWLTWLTCRSLKSKQTDKLFVYQLWYYFDKGTLSVGLPPSCGL